MKAHYYSLVVNIAQQNKLLKGSAFSLKSIMHSLSWNTGGMHGIFLSFKNVFSIDHWALELVALLDNFWDNFE